MKKYIIVALALIMAILPNVPARAENTLLYGQKHYYTVQLRSDKRAIVYARIIFQNGNADQDLSTYQFTLPKDVSIENTSVQQILAKNTAKQSCSIYETIDEWRTRVNEGPTYRPDSQYTSTRLCLEVAESAKYDEDFDYDSNLSSRTNYYYYSFYQTPESNFEYSDLEFTEKDGTYTVTLAEPVKPKKQGSVLVAFTTDNFVTGGFLGRYDYDVRTLIATQMIDRATVAVNFDNDMYTREAEQKREYESSTSSSITSGADSAGAANQSYQSRSIDNLLGTIGNGGMYVKTQSSLLSGDTLSVKGPFGTNKIILYTNEIITTLLLVAVAIMSFIAYRRWRKKHPRKHTSNTTDITDKSLNSLDLEQNANSTVLLSKKDATLTSLGVSAVSLLGTSLLMVALLVIVSFFAYSSSSGMEMGIATTSMFAVGIIGIILAPTLYMLRFGIHTVFRWSLIQILMVVIATIIVSLFFIDSSPRDVPDYYGYSDDMRIGTNNE